jgi:uncharacterized RDD family membrane protein YckC
MDNGPRDTIPRRIGARLVDAVLELGAGVLLAVVAIDRAVNTSDWEPLGLMMLGGAVFAATFALYEILFVWLWSRTPGKAMFGLRVAGPRGRRPGLWRAILRVVPMAAVLLPGPGWVFVAIAYGWVVLDTNGRGWHDRLAGTQVVDARR